MDEAAEPANAGANRHDTSQPEGILARLTALLGGQKVRDEKPRRIHVIINPAAGMEQPILKTLNLACRTAAVDWDVFVTKEAGDGQRLAREAVWEGADVVAVHGGDGTVMEVASGLIGSEVPLAIIPGGTANVMSVELGIPRDLIEATALAVSPPVNLRKVDMGRIANHYFMLRASVGFEAAMVEGASRELKDRFGLLAYAISAFQALIDPQIARYHLTLDGMEVEMEGITCIVANSGVMGTERFSLAPNILVDDGLLDVVVVSKADLPSLVSLAASVVGGQENPAALKRWQVREVTIASEPPLNLQADGEILGQTPVTAKVLPQAVSLIVPAPAASVKTETSS
jgi:YegS/Rv2252/BmrU family lipid kinase